MGIRHCLRLAAALVVIGVGLLSTASAEASPATATVSARSPASASSTAVPTHSVAVGATGFTFVPDKLTANIGDVVEFNFYPGGHSVVRSAFKFPCIPYEDTGPNLVGFFSGVENTNVYSSGGPKFRVRINDSEPIFYYCAAPGSCIDHHMIGVINPNASWSLEIQEAYVANTTVMVSPGQPLPSETAPGATPTATGGNSASSSPPPHSSSSSSHHGLTGGQIAGIVIGVLAAVFLTGIAVFLCCRSSRWQEARQQRRRRQSLFFWAGGVGGPGGNGDGGGSSSIGSILHRNSNNRTPSTTFGGPGSPSSPIDRHGSAPLPASFMHHQSRQTSSAAQQQDMAARKFNSPSPDMVDLSAYHNASPSAAMLTMSPGGGAPHPVFGPAGVGVLPSPLASHMVHPPIAVHAHDQNIAYYIDATGNPIPLSLQTHAQTPPPPPPPPPVELPTGVPQTLATASTTSPSRPAGPAEPVPRDAGEAGRDSPTMGGVV